MRRGIWCGWAVLALLTLGPAAGAQDDGDPDAGTALIGSPAPGWSFDRWVRGKATTPERLRGKVVLLRWWTEGCHFCETTLPVIEAARTRHAKDGLVTIGVFHPKPPREVSDRQIIELANDLGYRGPIAFDRTWSTLERYWLDGHPERNWTSVSFLIGRDGTIRWVHGGGEYHPAIEPAHARCAIQYEEFLDALEAALAEPAAALR